MLRIGRGPPVPRNEQLTACGQRGIDRVNGTGYICREPWEGSSDL